MINRNRLLIVTIVLGLVGVLAACALLQRFSGYSPSGDPSGSTQPTITASTASTMPTPQPSATPTMSTTSSDITAKLTEYYQVLDKLAQKPPKDPYVLLLTVSRDEAFEMWQAGFVQDRTKGWHQVGDTRILSISVGKMVSKNEYKASSCTDVSNVDLVDKSGKSVLNGKFADKESSALLVKRIKGSWYVVQDRDGTAKC